MCVVSLHSSVNPQLLASVFNMTKRDSVFAGIDPPRAPTSMQRRQSHLHGQSNSGATSSDGRSRPSTAMGTLPQNLHHGMDHSGSHSHAHHYGYTSVTPSVPLPEGLTTYPHEEEAYPLQAEIEQQHRVLHTHIFKEVISPHPTGINRLMVTEVDRLGVQRNRQPEFFFNGIVGHIRADRHGWINSWEQSTQLANYWRRHFNIPEVNTENNSWHHHQQPSDNADRHEESQESTPKSKMEDDDSIAANVGTASAPSQIHQLATVLRNILNNDSTPMLRSSRSLRIQEMT